MAGTVRYLARAEPLPSPLTPGRIDIAWRNYLPGKDGGIGISDGMRPPPAR